MTLSEVQFSATAQYKYTLSFPPITDDDYGEAVEVWLRNPLHVGDKITFSRDGMTYLVMDILNDLDGIDYEHLGTTVYLLEDTPDNIYASDSDLPF